MSIGVDLVYLPRIKDPFPLAKRILSSWEYQQFESHPRPIEFLAGRFAAKEAFIKAYNTLPFPDFSTIEVRIGDHGKPYILFQDKSFNLSLSHDGEYAIAFVVI
jgi:holo-[acyl-carrier protein] synthase